MILFLEHVVGCLPNKLADGGMIPDRRVSQVLNKPYYLILES